MAEIALTGITRRYGATTTLDDVAMTVPDGAFVALLGPSGARKTTVLRMVAGLDSPGRGRGRHRRARHGRTDASAARHGHGVSVIPPLTDLTVRENRAFPLRSPVPRMPEPEIARIVGRVAETLQIAHKLANEATALRGGETQRVSIGRAPVRRPSVYLMDEPPSSLDAKLRSDPRSS